MTETSILFTQNAKSNLAKYVYDFVNRRSAPVYFSVMNSQQVVESLCYPRDTTHFDKFVCHHFYDIKDLYSTPYVGLYDDMPQHIRQFIKMFELFRISSSEYRMPISARLKKEENSDNKFWWLHPGACRTAVLEYLHVSKIPILIFDDPDKLLKKDNINLINLKECSIERIHQLLKVDKNFTASFFKYCEFNGTEYFEISESPKHAKNFLSKDTDAKHKIEFSTENIFINGTRLCFKQNSRWVPDIESIQNHE